MHIARKKPFFKWKHAATKTETLSDKRENTTTEKWTFFCVNTLS